MMNTAKQEHSKCSKFSRFFERRSLADFHEYKLSIGLYNGEKPVVQLLACHDLHTENGEFVLKRIAIGYVVHSIQTGVSLNR